MILSRETDYALRALRALADGRKKTLSAICEIETIPQQFGYKILKKLAGAGFVTIKRGKEGGYTIAEDFAERTLYDLTGAMENPMDISPCIKPNYICERHFEAGKPCNVNVRLAEMQRALDSQLQSVNLYELLAEN